MQAATTAIISNSVRFCPRSNEAQNPRRPARRPTPPASAFKLLSPSLTPRWKGLLYRLPAWSQGKHSHGHAVSAAPQCGAGTMRMYGLGVFQPSG